MIQTLKGDMDGFWAVSELLNGHTGISPAMAVRLSLAFGGSAESWLTQQAQYDLWKVRQNPPEVKRLQMA